MQEQGSSEQAASRLMARESGLARALGARQLTMIALGGAIGTGLFLGSALAVKMAGPGVIVSYGIGALLAWLLTRALAEMAVAHPTAGSFGAYAELYTSPWAGFAVRWSYWLAQALVIGADAAALAIYAGWWFPAVPAWAWVAGFGALLVGLNARSVQQFGQIEYVFSAVKLLAIACFVVFGVLLIVGYVPGSPAVGLRNLTANGGFLPMGWAGVWLAVSFVIFGFIGTEVVAVTAGEAEDPVHTVPKSLRNTVLRLTLFYVAAIFVLVTIVPWNSQPTGEGVTASPFVLVFQQVGIPAAAHLVNFVVLVAALSAMNCNLYTATRTLFSLARAGQAPRALGTVSASGVPVGALAATSSGLVVAVLLAAWLPGDAFFHLFGVAMFAGLFAWLTSFITHVWFRRVWAREGRTLPLRLAGGSGWSALGALAVFAIMVTSWWVPAMHVTLLVGIPWVLLLSVVYWVWFRGVRA